MQSIGEMNKDSFAKALGFSQHSISPVVELRKTNGPESYRSHSYPCLHTENLQGTVYQSQSFDIKPGFSIFSWTAFSKPF